MRLLFIIIGLLQLHSVQAQEIDISDWQKSHPEVMFIEQNLYNTFSEEQLNKIGENVIVFNAEIHASDIDNYLTQKNLKSNNNALYEYSDSYADYFKLWIGTHQEIKIIPRTYFENTTETERALLLSNDALILIGEKITLTDIENYDAQH